MMIFKKLINNFFDLIFPIECLGCGKEGVFVCEDCLRGVEPKRDFPCVVCGRETFFGRTHKECLEKTNVDGVLCATNYKDELVGRMTRTFKYNLVRDLGPSLAWVMMRYLRGLMRRVEFSRGGGQNRIMEMIPKFLMFPGGGQALARHQGKKKKYCTIEGEDSYPRLQDEGEKPILIPIPLHPRRMRERGFNQAEILARVLGHYFNWPVMTNVLTRKRYTTAQVNLKASERERNIRDAFDEEGKKGEKRKEDTNDTNESWGNANTIKNRMIILIDDVLTTGATLNEAGKVLKGMGALEVWGVCLAKD